MEKENRIYGLSYVRAIACIGIIFIHAIYSAIVLFGKDLSLAEHIAYRSILNNLMWAVPCFFMVTGILLLNPEKEIAYGKLFKKYIARILGAIVVFGFIFTLLELIFSNDQTGINQILNGLYEVFAGKSWSHMWYLYALVGLYLLLPFYKMITKNSEEKDIRYLLIVLFVFLSIVPLLDIWEINCGFYIHVSTIYPFWLFLGYYMKHWGMKKSKWFYGIMAVLSIAIITLLTWFRWSYEVASLEKFFSYSSCIVIVQTIGIFTCICGSRLLNDSVMGKVLCFIDKHSFGIYLIHLIFIRGIYKHLHFNPFQSFGMFSIIGVVVVSLGLSLVLDILLRKIPVFSKIL